LPVSHNTAVDHRRIAAIDTLLPVSDNIAVSDCRLLQLVIVAQLYFTNRPARDSSISMPAPPLPAMTQLVIVRLLSFQSLMPALPLLTMWQLVIVGVAPEQ
jgi:hypothetical protein